MAGFSIGDAGTAGFRLVFKKPLTVFVWGLVYLLIAVVPSLLLLGSAGPDLMEMIRQAQAGADPKDMEGMINGMASMQAMQPVGWLTKIVASALVTAAIFRAVMEPSNKGAFYLRLGSQEMWQGLVQLCLGVFLAILIIGVILAFAVVGGVAVGASAAASGGLEYQPWMVPAGVVAGLVLLAVIIWLCLRFSMALPMTFADRTFRLFESWSFTKGRTGSLFLTGLLVIALVIVTEIVMALILGVLLVGGIAGAGAMTNLEQIFERPSAEWLPALGIAGLIALPVLAFFTGAM
ncbi:MAG: hypothetical protein ACXWVJ_08685, partial [Caulobacteraceae bacterium]